MKRARKSLEKRRIAPAPEVGRWGWRNLLANTTISFGINNIFDTSPPLSVDNVISNFDNANGANYIQRYFWFSIDRKF
jgi:outer membrane receptor protein involved in Fe transport